MAYTIVQEICIQCGSCAPFCKQEAIDWINSQYVIDPERCEMCSTCLEYCPIDNAIVESHAQGNQALRPLPHNN